MNPQRIQRKRTKGWRMPKGAVYVGRPTKWGNPYNAETLAYSVDGSWDNIRPSTREEQVNLYRVEVGCTDQFCQDINEHAWADALDVQELRGKDLACWCSLDQPCHADVLLKLANAEMPA